MSSDSTFLASKGREYRPWYSGTALAPSNTATCSFFLHYHPKDDEGRWIGSTPTFEAAEPAWCTRRAKQMVLELGASVVGEDVRRAKEAKGATEDGDAIPKTDRARLPGKMNLWRIFDAGKYANWLERGRSARGRVSFVLFVSFCALKAASLFPSRLVHAMLSLLSVGPGICEHAIVSCTRCSVSPRRVQIASCSAFLFSNTGLSSGDSTMPRK